MSKDWRLQWAPWEEDPPNWALPYCSTTADDNNHQQYRQLPGPTTGPVLQENSSSLRLQPLVMSDRGCGHVTFKVGGCHTANIRIQLLYNPHKKHSLSLNENNILIIVLLFMKRGTSSPSTTNTAIPTQAPGPQAWCLWHMLNHHSFHCVSSTVWAVNNCPVCHIKPSAMD